MGRNVSSAREAVRRSAEDMPPRPLNSGAHAATRGAIITLSGRGVRLVCQLVGLTVLARFLGPAEYGLVAMAGAIVGVAGVLGDFGLSLSALRAPVLTSAERNALFWFSTLLGAAFALAVAATGPSLAGFYRQPAVTPIVLALTPLFLINGAVAQYRVDALRRRKYVSIALVDTLSSGVGLISGIVAAMNGLGYWTLVLQNWAVSTIGLALTVFVCGWLPRWPARGGNLRRHLNFGSYSTLTQVINYIGSNASVVALGRFLGPVAVGTYSRAFQLFNLPVDQVAAPLTPVILPLLAKVDPNRLEDVLQRVQRCLVYSILGICLMVAVGGAPLASLLLGRRWAEAGDVVQILMAGAVFQLSGYVYYWAFLVTGRTNVLFWCEAPPRVVMVGLVAIGASYGPSGAALGHSMGLAACWLVPAAYGVRRLGWRAAPLAFGPARPVLLYLWAFLIGATVRGGLQRAGVELGWCVGLTFLATTAAVSVALVIPSFRKDARELLDLACLLRGGALFKPS
jgi:PST family polysaccharide transporter